MTENLLRSALLYWRGDGPLWRLFWIWGVLLSTAGGSLLLAATLSAVLHPLSVLLLAVAGLAYTLLIVVGIWRCAFNIRSRRVLGIERGTLGWMARLLTFAWAINAVGATVFLLQVAFGVISL